MRKLAKNLSHIDKRPILSPGFWKVLILIVTVAYIGLLCYGVALVFGGYHSLDQSRDLMKMSYELKSSPDHFQLCSISNECDSFDNVYIGGIRMLLFGYLLSLISAFGVSFSLVALGFGKGGENERI